MIFHSKVILSVVTENMFCDLEDFRKILIFMVGRNFNSQAVKLCSAWIKEQEKDFANPLIFEIIEKGGPVESMIATGLLHEHYDLKSYNRTARSVK